MTTSPTPDRDRVTAIYDAIDSFQREHRTVGGLGHAQIRALLAEHLDRALPPVPAAGQQPPVDRAALRDRIDAALKGCGVYDPEEGIWRSLSSAWVEEIAPAVLAVLPEPADRAAVLREAATEAEAENAQCNAVGPCQQCSARTTVAIRLRRRADEAQQSETHVVADDSDDPEHVDDCPGCTPAAGARQDGAQR